MIDDTKIVKSWGTRRGAYEEGREGHRGVFCVWLVRVKGSQTRHPPSFLAETAATTRT